MNPKKGEILFDSTISLPLVIKGSWMEDDQLFSFLFTVTTTEGDLTLPIYKPLQFDM